MRDAVLIARCRHGDGQAFRRIYEKHRDNLLVLAVAYCRDVHMAEDAVQDAFIRFAEGLPDFRLTGTLRAYLATCVVNRIRDMIRVRRRDAERLRHRVGEAGRTEDPGRVVLCNEQLRQLSEALARLPAEQRDVIVLRTYGGMRFRAIAQAQNVPASTVKARYRYGITRLRLLLNGEDLS